MAVATFKLWFNQNLSTNIKAPIRKQSIYNAELVFGDIRYFMDFAPPSVLLEFFDKSSSNIKDILLDFYKDYRSSPNFLTSIPKPKNGHSSRLIDTETIALLGLGTDNSPTTMAVKINGHIHECNIMVSQKNEPKAPDYFGYIEY